MKTIINIDVLSRLMTVVWYMKTSLLLADNQYTISYEIHIVGSQKVGERTLGKFPCPPKETKKEYTFSVTKIVDIGESLLVSAKAWDARVWDGQEVGMMEKSVWFVPNKEYKQKSFAFFVASDVANPDGLEIINEKRVPKLMNLLEFSYSDDYDEITTTLHDLDQVSI